MSQITAEIIKFSLGLERMFQGSLYTLMPSYNLGAKPPQPFQPSDAPD